MGDRDMSEWKQKRFWTDVSVVPDESGYRIELDGRRIRTPAKVPLAVPTQALAESIAAEWAAQVDVVKPATMPFTRTTNAAIDKVLTQQAEVAEMIAAYGDADLLCYRAEAPDALVARQQEAWDPALDWVQTSLGVRPSVRAGVMHVPQAPETLTTLAAQVHALTHFELAAFHDLVSLSGSLVLGLAAAADWRPASEIWNLSRVDEQWQAEQWGSDEDAEIAARIKQDAFEHAKRYLDRARD